MFLTKSASASPFNKELTHNVDIKKGSSIILRKMRARTHIAPCIVILVTKRAVSEPFGTICHHVVARFVTSVRFLTTL